MRRKPAAADRSAVDPSQNEKALGRRHLLLRLRVALARIEAALETRREFPEICGEAPPGCRIVRRDDPNFDCGRPDQALDFRHRSQETLALMCAERRQHRRRQLVREPVIGGQFRSTFGSQPHASPTAVGASRGKADR